MSNAQSAFVCQQCGHRAPKWMGKCPGCGEWDTYVEEVTEEDDADGDGLSSSSLNRSSGSESRGEVIALSEVDRDTGRHIPTGIAEFDRVTGGGLVPASVTLLGGPPGVGKSTLLLQLAGEFPLSGPVIYVTAEESPGQISRRADRLRVERGDLLLQSSTALEEISGNLKNSDPGLVIVDSIQAVHHPDLSSSPGSVAQVRRCAKHLTDLAKQRGFPLVLIGHVTKEGRLAGPRVLEHLVDCVLQMETDREQRFRTLRALKNRFGSTRELGLLVMDSEGLHSHEGLVEIELENWQEGRSGSAHGLVLEGSRTLLVEVQALVSQSAGGHPGRVALGIPRDKLNLIAALLEKRVGLDLASRDIHLSVVGGLSFTDPALDLAVAGAIYSSYYDRAPTARTVLIGELDLSASVRTVTSPEKRLQALDRFEVSTVLMNYPDGRAPGPEVLQVNGLTHALAEAFGDPQRNDGKMT